MKIKMDVEINDKYQKIIEIFQSKFKFIGKGNSRICFRFTSNLVIKVPLNEIGEQNNIYEADTYKKFSAAKCVLHNYLGVNILIMEFISKIENNQKLTESEKLLYLCSDCGQVGYNRSRKLVYYDWGIF
jgi:hypothetical protein